MNFWASPQPFLYIEHIWQIQHTTEKEKPSLYNSVVSYKPLEIACYDGLQDTTTGTSDSSNTQMEKNKLRQTLTLLELPPKAVLGSEQSQAVFTIQLSFSPSFS